MPAGFQGTASLGTLYLRLQADSAHLVKGMAAAEASVKGGVGRMAVGLTALAATAVGAFAAIGTAGINAFAEFDAAMTKSTAIMEDLSDTMRKQLEETARTIATNSTTSATKLAATYFELASAGLTAEQSQSALNIVNQFSIAGAFDLNKATELLVDSQQALGLRVEDTAQNMANMTRVSDVLVKANNIASGTVEDYASALQNKASAALKLVNKDIEEGVAVLAVFASQGVKGAGAGEKLAIVLRDLQRVALHNREDFKQLGIAVFDSEDNMRNMADIVEDFERVLAPMSVAQKRATFEMLGFQDRSLAATLGLVGFSGQIREYEKSLRSAGGETDKVSEKMQQGFSAQLQITRNRIDDLLISIGEGLAPQLRELNKALGDFVQRNSDASESLRSNVEAISNGFAFVAKGIASIFTGIMSFMRLVGVAILGIANDMIAGIKDAIGFINKLIGVANKVRSHFGGELIEPIDVDFKVGGQSLDEWMKTVELAQAELWKDLEKGVFKQVELGEKGVAAVANAGKGVIAEVGAAAQATQGQLDKVQRSSAGVMAIIEDIRATDKDLGIGSDADQKRAASSAALGSIQNQDVTLGKGLQQEIARTKGNLAILEESSQREVELTVEAQAAKLKAIEDYNNRLRDLQLKQAEIILGSATSIFDNLSGITAGFASKQSGIYKAMFAASKAFAIAESTVKIAQGIATAASLGFPAGIVGIAQVLAATASIVSSIQSVQLEFGGGKAAGGPVAPGKTFLVGERGPELFSPGSAGNITPNDRLGGGRVSVIVNNFTDAQAEVRETNNGDEKTFEIIIARTKNSIATDIRQGTGEVNKSLQSSFGLKRAGR